jgi:hypothetical protein
MNQVNHLTAARSYLSNGDAVSDAVVSRGVFAERIADGRAERSRKMYESLQGGTVRRNRGAAEGRRELRMPLG